MKSDDFKFTASDGEPLSVPIVNKRDAAESDPEGLNDRSDVMISGPSQEDLATDVRPKTAPQSIGNSLNEVNVPADYKMRQSLFM